MRSVIFLLLFLMNASFGQFSTTNDSTKSKGVLVTSEPSGSNIFINEILYGKTPLEIHNLPDLPFELQLRDQDGNVWNSNIIEIPFGNSIHALIQQDYALVKVFTSPSQAELYLNDSLAGKTPLGEIKIPLGITKISVRKDGYQLWESGVAARKEKSQLYTFNVKLESIYSELNFPPGFKNIYVDNVPVDESKYLIRAGEHLIITEPGSNKRKLYLDTELKAGESYNLSLREKQFFYTPVLYSALLPGTGQYSDGSKVKGILTFTAVSALTAAGVITSQNYSQKAEEYNLLRKEYLNAKDEVSAIGAKTMMNTAKENADKALLMKKVTIGLAACAYLYNIADALIFHSFKDILQIKKLEFGISYNPTYGSGNISLNTQLKF